MQHRHLAAGLCLAGAGRIGQRRAAGHEPGRDPRLPADLQLGRVVGHRQAQRAGLPDAGRAGRGQEQGRDHGRVGPPLRLFELALGTTAPVAV
jgi:hypothetical protein